MGLLLELKDVTIGYRDSIVLPHLSWQVSRGDRWAIVGANGSGKTTLIRSILGLIPFLEGGLSYYDKDGGLTSSPPSVGYLPQVNNIDKHFPIDVEEVVYSGLYGTDLSEKEKRERVSELLEVIQLTPYRRQAIGKLSGGQLQKVLLARALGSKPELLVLDEPTSFLDIAYKEQFLSLLNTLVEPDATILMVTHDLPSDELDYWKCLALGRM